MREIVETDSHLVISALQGDAAAGGVPFAIAADHVVARTDVVLNPYYQHMGGLYGSEYWTYLLPRRIGAELTGQLTSAPFRAIGTRRAVEIGLIDEAFGDDVASFAAQVRGLAERLARHDDHARWLAEKRRRRAVDEQVKPLSVYRTRSSRARTSASSGPTAATTRPGADSCTRPARHARSRHLLPITRPWT